MFTADDPPDGIRMALPNPLVVPDAVYTHLSVDGNGVFHLYTNSTDMVSAPLLPCRDLEREAVLDAALTVAPLWAPLEFGTQSVVRVYEIGAAYLNVEYERMRLQDSPDAPENEASVQAWVGLDIDGNLIVDLHYANVGSNVWNAASVGFRAPGGRTCQTFSHLGSRTLSQGVVTFDAWTGLGTDPVLVDTDGDGLSDGDEVLTHGSSPLLADTDGDGLADPEELLKGTSLSLADTDHDGLPDGLEVSLDLDPLQPDSDGDGMNDGWENQHDGFDPLSTNDGNADPDDDGATNTQESEAGTDPGNPDTDEDGISDGTEIT